ncbi:MAG: alpha/beta fold hydrolase [Pseudomonadales bacterium]|nr:alpha/beta fold hydrolase [Pseudomonadales bacterium]
MSSFKPPLGLSNPHLQTMCSSAVRKLVLRKSLAPFLLTSRSATFEVFGQKLSAAIHRQEDPEAPMIAIVPGWLGSAESSYALGFAHALWNTGYSIARLTLRDHGETAELNETMFNSSLTDEVVQFVQASLDGAKTRGVLGFSLGGNFALRVARAEPDLTALAICPAIEPRDTMFRIDRNFIYQRYFLNKWREIWRAKANVYPHLYRYSDIAHLNSIQTLTEHFVQKQTVYEDVASYFASYDLSGDALAGVDAKILAAADDPIIPFSDFANLPDSLDIDVTQQGGHGAYLKNWQMDSWLDDYVVKHFQQHLPI